MSWLSAIGSVISSAADVASNVFGANKSSEVASRNLASQLDWERERATNAHQWEVEDLRAAGLNPILSATGGSGAHTSPITPQMPDLSGYGRAGSAFGNAFTKAYEVLTADKNLNQQDANIALTLQNAKKAAAETANTAATTLLISKQFEKANHEIALLREEIAHQGFKNYIRFESPLEAYYADLYGNNLPASVLKGFAGALGDYQYRYDPKLRKLVPRTSTSTAKDLIQPKEKNPWSTYQHPYFRR